MILSIMTSIISSLLQWVSECVMFYDSGKSTEGWHIINRTFSRRVDIMHDTGEVLFMTCKNYDHMVFYDSQTFPRAKCLKSAIRKLLDTQIYPLIQYVGKDLKKLCTEKKV